MKIKIFFLITSLLTILGMALVFSNSTKNSNSYVAVEQANASSLDKKLPTPTPYPTAVAGVTGQAMQKFARSEIVTDLNNGVEISAANWRYENNQITVDVCFHLPDTQDWLIDDAVVQYGDKTALLDTTTLLEQTLTQADGQKLIQTVENGFLQEQAQKSDGGPDYRCDTLTFITPPNIALPTEMTLEIRAIRSTPKEGEECTKNLDKIQSILNARNTGIKIDCVQQSGGARLIVAQKPDSMSKQTAEQMISSDEFYTIKGLWIFDGSIQ